MAHRMSLMVAAASLTIAPATLAAATVGATPGGAQVHSAPATPHSATGNGGGYNHMNSPQHVTGQPSQSCETTGSPPGNSSSAPGSAFNPDGTAGSRYAGSAPQNTRNTASVSQYDVACSNQPH
jgi:hypothetical protein